MLYAMLLRHYFSLLFRYDAAYYYVDAFHATLLFLFFAFIAATPDYCSPLRYMPLTLLPFSLLSTLFFAFFRVPLRS